MRLQAAPAHSRHIDRDKRIKKPRFGDIINIIYLVSNDRNSGVE